MPAPSMTILLHPDGDDLDSVLHTRTVRLTVHDPDVESAIMLRGQRVPLAANFTAGYGLWLARANFNRQSLRRLLGREGGIDRPHVYLMQTYDPNRRIIVILHRLASSPEAWVELANEILGDEALRISWLAHISTQPHTKRSHHHSRPSQRRHCFTQQQGKQRGTRRNKKEYHRNLCSLVAPYHQHQLRYVPTSRACIHHSQELFWISDSVVDPPGGTRWDLRGRWSGGGALLIFRP